MPAEVWKRPRARDDPGITFESENEYSYHDNALVITARITNARIRCIMVDTGSSTDIMYIDAFQKLGITNRDLILMTSTLTGFTGDTTTLVGVATLPMTSDDEPRTKTFMVPFMVVDLPSAYNVIIKRPTLNKLRAIISTYHRSMKFPTSAGPGEIRSDPWESRRCYLAATIIPKRGKETPVPDPREPYKLDTRPEPTELILEVPLEKDRPKENLDLLEERRAEAHLKTLHYQRVVTRLYNQRIRPRPIGKEDLVLRKAEVSDPGRTCEKLTPRWEGPYRVTQVV
ncbi:hypothetical protein BHE74_00019069 [Ensete ventricosum]|nr:hypothetical protein BHE74_00019069 [Ensete ventricosum]